MKSKKVISLILALVMIMSVLFSATAFASGGYEVDSAEELIDAVKNGRTNIVVTADIELTETLVPTKNLGLSGKNGAVISGIGTLISTEKDLTLSYLTVSGATDSAIKMTDGILTVKSCVFKGNAGVSGGAICYSGEKTVNITNSIFENNTASENGGAIVLVSPCTVNITNCSFDKNSAIGEGGAVYAYNTWTIINVKTSSFTNNTAAGGGAIRNVYGSVESVDSVYSGNKATAYHGGAVYGWHLYATFTNCKLNNNYAAGNGGAVWVETTEGWPANQYAYLSVTGGEMCNNIAGVQAGAIGGQNLPYSVYVNDVVVSNNKATIGGVIYAWCAVDVRNCVFTNNKCDQNGGVIWSNWTVYCENSQFVKNYCKWYGGVAFSNLGNITFWKCELKNNQADPYYWGGGGVAHAEAADIYLASCVESGNKGFKNNIYNAKVGQVHRYEATDESVENVNKITIWVDPMDGYSIKEANVSGGTLTDGKYIIAVPVNGKLDVNVSASVHATRNCEIEQFTDITDDMSAHSAVDYVYSEGLMNGTSDSTFEPETLTNRAMIVTILYRMEGSPKVTYKNKFSDVKKGQWYSDAVIWAANNGIVNGYDNGKFGPEDLVTAEQLAAILYRYSIIKGKDMSESAELGEEYINADAVSEYAVDAMEWVSAKNLFGADKSNPVDVKGNVARIKLAVALYTMSF